MFKLKEVWRQVLAGLIAGVVFAISYLGFNLVGWASLLAGIAAYGATLLLIERAPEDHEVYVYANVTRLDVQTAVQQCEEAAATLHQASLAKQIDAETAKALEQLSQLITEIGLNYQQDPRDLKHSRSFITQYLPKLVELVNSYIALSERAVTEASRPRLKQIGQTLESYVPHVQTILEACLENDFAKLELETSVLGDVMKLSNPSSREVI